MTDALQQPLRVQYVTIGPDGRITTVVADVTPEDKVERPPQPEPPHAEPKRLGRLVRRRG
jgi:hypothetical protein